MSTRVNHSFCNKFLYLLIPSVPSDILKIITIAYENLCSLFFIITVLTVVFVFQTKTTKHPTKKIMKIIDCFY